MQNNEMLLTINHIKSTTQSLPEQVAAQINQLIIEHNIGPNQKLPNEFELAERLKVGRGTVREAVKLLVARNCLEVRRGKGTFVVEKTGQMDDPLGFAYVKDKIKLAEDLMELRLHVEPWVAQLAAQRIDEKEKSELRDRCELITQTIRNGENHSAADKAFHAFIAQCTHNSVISEIMPVINYSIEMYTHFRSPKLLEDTIFTHGKIVEAICNHDSAKAYEYMHLHVAQNKESIDIAKQSLVGNEQKNMV